MLIPFQYAQVNDFREGLASVSMDFSTLNPRWQFINRQGETAFILSDRHQLVDLHFQEGFVRIRTPEGIAFLNTKGELLGQIYFKDADPFANGLARVTYEENGKRRMGCLDNRGRLAVPAIYEFVSPSAYATYWGALYKVQKDGRWGVVDTRHKEIIPAEFEDVYFPPFPPATLGLADDRLAVKKDGKWGFVNRRGKLVIAPKYEQIYDFIDGYARVQYQGQWGYIDAKGTAYFED
ncbi:MAG: WG repeat-containing protein [Bacteroidia bacterium]|nr:WG repeat-containing protein [Bacteroidia bacterium]